MVEGNKAAYIAASGPKTSVKVYLMKLARTQTSRYECVPNTG